MTKKKKVSEVTNHIVFLIDNSGSMENLTYTVQKVFTEQLDALKRNAKKFGQETKVSLFHFSDSLRTEFVNAPIEAAKMTGFCAGGRTALINSVIKVVDCIELIRSKDESVLFYVLTDGEENEGGSSGVLSSKLSLLPEEWTVSCLVPNRNGEVHAKDCGFPAENILIWETTESGLKRAGEVMTQSYDTYFSLRSTGAKGTKRLFSLDTTNLNKAKKALKELNPNQYLLAPVVDAVKIKEFVESRTGRPYRTGSAYYQFTKPEVIQNYKQICVQDKSNGRVYSGAEARQLLGIPDYEVKVDPASHPNYTIYIQSMSYTRNLVPGTNLIVLN